MKQNRRLLTRELLEKWRHILRQKHLAFLRDLISGRDPVAREYSANQRLMDEKRIRDKENKDARIASKILGIPEDNIYRIPAGERTYPRIDKETAKRFAKKFRQAQKGGKFQDPELKVARLATWWKTNFGQWGTIEKPPGLDKKE